MGLLSDIYISSDGEALSYDASPEQFTERVQYKRISPLELSTLWAIIRDVEWDSLEEPACVLIEDEGERLIHRLPSAMVSDLARLTPDQIGLVSEKWGETEELDWPPGEARPVVEDLVRLARRAIESGRNVYLWNCV